MDDREIEVLLNEYERAQDVAQHSDAVFWEITAITWGANTLMLGFVLEAISDCKARLLIEVTAVLGMVLSALPAATYHSGKIGQRISFQACRDIEARLQTFARLHTNIDVKYPRHFVKWLVYVVTGFFALSWAAVGFVDFRLGGMLTVVAVGVVVSFSLWFLWKLGLRRP